MNSILERLKSVFAGLKFNPATHTYTDEYNTKFISCTQFENLFKFKKDWDAIRKKYAEDHHVDEAEVKAKWEAAGKYATTLGTEVHSVMEYLWQGKDYPGNPEVFAKYPGMAEDFEARKKIATEMFKKMSVRFEPVANEFRVYDRDIKIAGTIDFIAWDKIEKNLVIIDWKSSKKFDKSSFKPGEMMSYPFNDYQDCNTNQYSLQLSVYKYIVEKNTGLKVGKLILFQLPKAGKYPESFVCHDMCKEINLLFNN